MNRPHELTERRVNMFTFLLRIFARVERRCVALRRFSNPLPTRHPAGAGAHKNGLTSLMTTRARRGRFRREAAGTQAPTRVLERRLRARLVSPIDGRFWE